MNLGLSYAVSCSLTTKQLYLKNCRKTLSENVKTTLKLSPTFRRQNNCYVYLAKIR